MFNASEKKYGLWKSLSFNGKVADADNADAIKELFILNADSKKAVTVAKLVIDNQKGLAEKFVATFGKSDGLEVRLTVTKDEVIRRANAILELSSSHVSYAKIKEGKADDSATRKSDKSSKVAGLIAKS